MTNFNIIFPIKSLQHINICETSRANSVYIYHNYFLEHGLHEIKDFVSKAKEKNCKLYVNFGGNIYENELQDVKKILNYVLKQEIAGILINSFAVLELIKAKKLPFEVMIDSDLGIHNLSGIEFVSQFHRIDNLNLSEEVYIKNIAKIKKYTKLPLSINSDNIPWLIEDIKKSKAIEAIVIKGDFDDEESLANGVSLVEKIVDKPKIFKNQKLPFKTPKNVIYESNHFSGEFVSSKGIDFDFSGNIQRFDWIAKQTRLKKDIEIKKKQLPKLCLRLSSFEHIKYLKKYIKHLGFNPVHSIEYGEILNTSDLAKNSFNQILNKIKKFCYKQKIKLQISTPRILIERDFDRVYEYVRQLFIEDPYPSSIIVNNTGYWWAVTNDSDFERTSIELGQGLDLTNSLSILCLANQHNVSSIDISNFENIEDIQVCIKKIKKQIPNIKLTVGGSIRIPCSGLCPLNNDSAILSRLSCTAPCQNGNYAIIDPSINEAMPFTVDGFCRMHMFRDKILDIFKYTKTLSAIGVTEFVIDFNGLNANLIPIMLNKYLNAFYDPNYQPDEGFETKKYNLEWKK